MELEYIDIRDTFASGGSVKVTIPMRMVKEVWRKSEERLSEGEGRPGEFRTLTVLKSFPVCFIRGDGKLIIELPENAMGSTDYPGELRNKIREEWSKYQRRLLAEECDKLYVKFAIGEISEQEIERQFGQFRSKFKQMARFYRRAFSDRELHFIASDDLGQLLATISIDQEREKEESFLSLMDDVKKLKEELEGIRDVLNQLERGFTDGRIGAEQYRILRERNLGKLSVTENRLNRLKMFVCT